MSRLCVKDAHLFAKYKQGRLTTNVCLISCDQLSFDVESGELRKHSDTLADMAETAINTSGSRLVFEEVTSHTLKLLVEAMYGQSMKQTCSISDVAALSSFGHKYGMDQMEAILCEVLVTLDPVDFSATAESVTSCQAVPVEFTNVQDGVFQYMLRGYKHIHTDIIAEVIKPKHVNQWLQQMGDSTQSESLKGRKLLSKLQGITQQVIHACTCTGDASATLLQVFSFAVINKDVFSIAA
ncbi:hypothetical protein ABBQ32_002908 [Trebouxia sp. C0010 RCD-2024]